MFVDLMRVVISLDFVHKIKRKFQENITLLFSASLYDFVSRNHALFVDFTAQMVS